MLAVLILAAFGLLTAVIGKAKGGSFFLWFVIGFVLPGIGVIVVLLNRSEHSEPERRCPRCGSIEKLYVQVCTVCGEDLYLPPVEEVRTPGAIAAAQEQRRR